MKCDFSEFYKLFEQVKWQKEFINYRLEMDENTYILNSIPFKQSIAKAQIHKLTTKYKNDLNRLANIYENGMFVVNETPKKNEKQIKNELQYINNQIPIIALVRELSKESIEKLLGMN